MKIIFYLRLFRTDAALIAFISYLVGTQLNGNVGFNDIFIGLLITFVSTNFIYSFNSWADSEIDKVGKPHRPIPLGKITNKQALIYSCMLFVLSIIYPFLIFKSYFSLVLMLLLPVLGLLYSAPPIRLRRFPVPAAIIICAGLVIPITLGTCKNGFDMAFFPLILSLYIFCMSAVPLKTIEEVKEDKATNSLNLYEKYGSKLLLYSLAGMLFNSFLTICLSIDAILKLYLIFVFLVSIAIIFFNMFRKKNEKTYTMLIRFVVISGAIYYISTSLI